MMLRQQIRKDIKKAVSDIGYQVSGIDIEVARSQDPGFGDYSTNIALKASREGKHSPMEFARLLSDSLKNLPYIKKLEVKEPGFINFFIKDEYWQNQVEVVLTSHPFGVNKANGYGSNSLGKGKKARVEFVSANPTGPLHFGNARGGPIGDVLASVLEFSGWKVLREYIDNDRGNQVTELGKTLAVKADLIDVQGESLPYQGEYTQEVAAKVKKIIGNVKGLSEQELIVKSGEIGVKILFEEIIADCKAIGITFDLIVHESDLQKEAPQILAELQKKGMLTKKEGATWFAPRLRPSTSLRVEGSGQAPKNQFLKDKDAVVVKSDGNYTYFTADVVYHKQKFESGYDLVVDVFGSNTIGHVPKLKALAVALDFDIAKFKVVLYQFVRIKRGKEIVKMSKRAGNFVTAKEVLDEVGRDAFRFFILMHDANTHMDFDLALAKERSSKNPVYYVQYANARIQSILAKSKMKGHPFDKLRVTLSTSKGQKSKVNYQLLTTNYELNLIKQISRLEELVADIAVSFAVHQLTSYAIDLADSFHKFYENCPVLTEKADLRSARLALCRATQIALANTLRLLGVSAPEKM